VQERPIKALSHLQPLRIYTYLQQHQNKSILLIGHPPVKPTLSAVIEPCTEARSVRVYYVTFKYCNSVTPQAAYRKHLPRTSHYFGKERCRSTDVRASQRHFRIPLNNGSRVFITLERTLKDVLRRDGVGVQVIYTSFERNRLYFR
jgi:hypothetical protein